MYKSETKLPSIRSPQVNLLRKVAKDTEGACVFIGRPDNISIPFTQFVRLRNATMMKNLFEQLLRKQIKQLHHSQIPIPLRFLFVLLVPKEHVEKEAEAIARCMGTLFIDEVFSKVCYKARDGNELCQGIDEFLSQCVVVPAGRLSLNCRLEPHENLLPVTTFIQKNVMRKNAHFSQCHVQLGSRLTWCFQQCKTMKKDYKELEDLKSCPTNGQAFITKNREEYLKLLFTPQNQ
ncbi:band 3 cytoplasmic domain protein [Trichuris suis]|nr:band 3 cytoplasmic domain protein [Trichuris suis]